MKRVPLLLGAVFFLLYKLLDYQTGNPWLSMLVFMIPIGALAVSFAVRKRLRFKNWFLSPYNIFFERKSNDYTSDLSSELLLDKLKEMLETTDFEVFDTDDHELSLLCGTKPNFWTWGENIYIEIESRSSEESVIRFTSTTLFGNTSWGRNQRNYESFVSSFEDSLTI